MGLYHNPLPAAWPQALLLACAWGKGRKKQKNAGKRLKKINFHIQQQSNFLSLLPSQSSLFRIWRKWIRSSQIHSFKNHLGTAFQFSVSFCLWCVHIVSTYTRQESQIFMKKQLGQLACHFTLFHAALTAWSRWTLVGITLWNISLAWWEPSVVIRLLAKTVTWEVFASSQLASNYCNSLSDLLEYEGVQD